MSGTHNFHAVEYLTPTDYTVVAGLVEPTAWSFNPTPPVTSGYGNGRAMPDVSADADPHSGYLVYKPSYAAIGQPVCRGMGWHQLRGAAAERFYRGHRLVPGAPGRVLEPVHVCRRGGHDPFTQLNQAGTSNDNLYYTGNPGELYNEGIGLGIPNLAELAGDLR